jgi:phosphoglycolate phosphatase
MKPIGLLIFDLDGTLVNTLGDITASLNHSLVLLGRLPVEVNTVRRYVGDGLGMLIERALGGPSEQAAEAAELFKEHHHQNFTAHSQLYPLVKETLEHFKALPLAVITNKNTEFCGPLLESLGIKHYFTRVIGGDAGFPIKPAPDSIEKIMALCNVPKEFTVMVGDSVADVQAGKAAGVTTCAVTYGYRSEEELRVAGPDYIVQSIAELKTLFVPYLRKPV